MMKYLFFIVGFVFAADAAADYKKNECDSVPGSAQFLNLTIDYEVDSKRRLRSYSVCEAKESSKYFVVLDDLPFEPMLVYRVSAQDSFRAPKKILHYSSYYDSWVVSLEESEFLQIQKQLNAFQNAKKEDMYAELDSFEICISSSTLSRRCYQDVGVKNDKRDLQDLVELRRILEGKFAQVR